MANRRGGTVLVALGLLLIAAALVLVGGNLLDDHRAGQEADRVLAALEGEPVCSLAHGAVEEGPQDPQDADYIVNPAMEMPTAQVEGTDYIGILEISSLGLSLPVASEWSYTALASSPCRYGGSAYDGGLVIAGHNYRTHFGTLGSLAQGDAVVFADAKGRRFSYEVRAIETLEATAVDDMTSEEWDLTLFTCTLDGQARLAVRCTKANAA